MTPKEKNIEGYLTTLGLQNSPSWIEIKQDLKELEALKKDVARFIELDDMLYLQGWHSKEETVEYQELRYKISKVGEKE